MITVVSKYNVKEDMLQEFKILAEELVKETRKEPGCISYYLNQDINHKEVLTFIEKWRSKDDIISHNMSEHFTRLIPLITEMQQDDAEVHLYERIV